MPNHVKKFKLTYAQVPKVFSLPAKLYTQNIANSIPEEALEQTEKQRKYIAATISQIDLDSDRNCYVDFDGYKASELRTDWITRNLDEKPTLRKGVFPSFTQGDNTAACIGEILHAVHFALPLNSKKPLEFMEVNPNTTKICFVYRTAEGKPAGFSLIACPNGGSEGKHKGWILSTIQNTTGQPSDRKVTVLASSNYVTSKAQSMTAMDNPKSIETELKAAINNDKVSNLIKGIFNQDGSLNADYITLLDSRINVSVNIDDRDRKTAQFHCLFELSRQIDDVNFQAYTDSVKKQMTKNIDFFKDEVYAKNLKAMLHQCAEALRKKTKSTKPIKEITSILENISDRVASIDALAEHNYRNIALANTYKALAKRIRDEAATIKFDGTRQDGNKIVRLSQFDVSRVQDKVTRFYATDPAILNYYANKTQSYQQMQDKLAEVPNPANQGFFSRNASALIFSVLVGLFVGITVALALTGMLAPLSVALIAVASGLVVAGGISGVGIYENEKKHTEKVNHYHDDLAQIRSEHEKGLVLAEQDLQKGINLDSFLESDKPEFLSQVKVSKRKPLTAESVAHVLWLNHKDPATTLNAKNRFSLWASQQENLGFGINEVESVIDKTYEMSL